MCQLKVTPLPTATMVNTVGISSQKRHVDSGVLNHWFLLCDIDTPHIWQTSGDTITCFQCFISVKATPSFTSIILPFCSAKDLPESDPGILFSRSFVVLPLTCTSLVRDNVEQWLHFRDQSGHAIPTVFNENEIIYLPPAQVHPVVKPSHQSYILEHM